MHVSHLSLLLSVRTPVILAQATCQVVFLAAAPNFLVLHLFPCHCALHRVDFGKCITGWEEEWVNTAEEIVHAEFDKMYGSLDASWAEQHSQTNIHLINPFFIIKVLHYCLLDPFCISKHL